jgi:uncharacterized protein (DUF736 family)
MAAIGTFSKSGDGFVGTIRTMTINVKAKITPNTSKASDNAPDYRVYAGGAELGAGWRETTKEDGRDYVALSLMIRALQSPSARHFLRMRKMGPAS